MIDEREDGFSRGPIEAKKLVFLGDPKKTHKNLSANEDLFPHPFEKTHLEYNSVLLLVNHPVRFMSIVS